MLERVEPERSPQGLTLGGYLLKPVRKRLGATFNERHEKMSP